MIYFICTKTYKVVFMDFRNLKIKEIESVIKFTPDRSEFSSKNKSTHIIGIQLSGSALHIFKDKQLVLSENSIYFFNQKDDYDVKVIEKGTAFSVHFSTYALISTDTFFLKIGNPGEIIRLLEVIESGFMSQSNELMLLSRFYRLCSLINTLYEKTFMPKDKRILNAGEYISAHFKDADCLDAAAKICGLSRRRFNDLFKNCFYITPNRYIINLKIGYAKGLLKSGYICVSQAAALCGFSDIYYFSKVFKAETGVSPSEYKRRCSKM
ncbi:MAG: AraC family transcriptional regulator [Clostridiales bacterium]|nr:AraC family transcriptional regulator [Clostridiales bacterium]